jgi:hypothetical protein
MDVDGHYAHGPMCRRCHENFQGGEAAAEGTVPMLMMHRKSVFAWFSCSYENFQGGEAAAAMRISSLYFDLYFH